MPRLFIALPAGEDVIEFFRPQYEFLQKFKSSIKAVPAENFHITVKFLGDCEDRLAEDILAAFKGLGLGFHPIPVRFRGIGTFPHIKKASVIWSGLEIEGEMVDAIVRRMDDFSSAFGFEREKRKFIPHLTLARVRRDKSLPPMLVDYIKENSRKEFIGSAFDRISLFESRLDSSGAAYEELHAILFGN